MSTSPGVFTDKLMGFQQNANKKTFEEVFPHDQNLANHLWRKFQEYDGNLLTLFMSLESHILAFFITYIDYQFGRTYQNEYWLNWVKFRTQEKTCSTQKSATTTNVQTRRVTAKSTLSE